MLSSSMSYLLLTAISSQKSFRCLARERAVEGRGVAGDKAADGMDCRAQKPYFWPIENPAGRDSVLKQKADEMT